MNKNFLRYQGREQTYIKHLFLAEYLQGAAYKIMYHYSRTFNFVDAFAGPWQTDDNDNYSDASFDQARRALDAVRENLRNIGLTGLRVRFCFCEMRAESVEQLRRYAKQKADFEIYVFSGAFEDNLKEISNTLKDGFTFTFIDPTGWNIRNEDVFKFLQFQKGEFLLNFMSDHINRHSGYEAVSKSIGHFLADPSWKGGFDALDFDWSNERKVLYILKSQMKKFGVAKYLPDFSIMLPHQERLKMRLILGTHVVQGLELFRDTQAKIEETQTRIRSDIRENKTRLGSLFSVEDHVQFEQQNKGVGCAKFNRIAKKQIIETLKESPDMRYSDLYPRVMENVAMRQLHINALLRDMKKRGVVNYVLPKGRRSLQPETLIKIIDENFTMEDLSG